MRTTRSFAAEGVEFAKYGIQIGDPDNGTSESDTISEQPLLAGSSTTTTATNTATRGCAGAQAQGGCTSCCGLCRCTFCGWIPEEESSYQLGTYKAIGFGAFGE